MSGTTEASTTVISQGNGGEKFSSVHDNVEETSRRMKCEGKDDLISSLPDCLIQHILSFLPSTKDAIRTGVLSKRWLHQWTYVPILIFEFNSGMSFENLFNFIDNALNLHNCSKINKFVIHSNDCFLSELRRKSAKWIRFALERYVKELFLDWNGVCVKYDEDDDDLDYQYELSQFLFNNAFLVKLKTVSCNFMPGNVNWASLKALYIGSTALRDQAIEKVLSGSPLIEYLELRKCYGFQRLDIASKSLKTLRIFKSSCPAIEITCPNLEKLELLGENWFKCLKLKDLPPSVCVTLDFENKSTWHFSIEDILKWVKELLLLVKNAQELKLGPWLLMMISHAMLIQDEFSPKLKNKCLTVMDPFIGTRQAALHMLLIKCSLLEKLVIQFTGGRSPLLEDSVKIGNEIWDLDGSIFYCLVSHLKTVEIVGLCHISDNDSRNDVLKFVEFLLKNARMLENMALLEAPGDEMNFAHEVCQKLSCIEKASQHAIIKVACLSLVELQSDSDWDNIVC